jgi:hypothetical protein
MHLGGCAEISCSFIWSYASGLMQFRDGSDKGTVSVHQIWCDDSTFLFRFITHDDSWISLVVEL